MQRCDVVGMTTTGAAKNRRLLSLLKCHLVLVEEAAQVLEPHVITALPPSCDHLVMIGESDRIDKYGNLRCLPILDIHH